MRRIRHWFIDWVTECMEEQSRVPEWLSAEIIRFETFSRLDLRHTCRDMSLVCPKYLTEEEIEQFREEDLSQIEKLGELVPEFVAKYSELDQPLLEFFEGYWATRMEDVLGAVNEEEIRRIEELGVVLQK